MDVSQADHTDHTFPDPHLIFFLLLIYKNSLIDIAISEAACSVRPRTLEQSTAPTHLLLSSPKLGKLKVRPFRR